MEKKISSEHNTLHELGNANNERIYDKNSSASNYSK